MEVVAVRMGDGGGSGEGLKPANPTCMGVGYMYSGEREKIERMSDVSLK